MSIKKKTPTGWSSYCMNATEGDLQRSLNAPSCSRLFKTEAGDLVFDHQHFLQPRTSSSTSCTEGPPFLWSLWFVVLSHLALIYSGKIIRISLLWRVEWKCKQCFPAGGCFITLTGAFEFAWVADRLGYLCVSRTWKPRLWLGLRFGLKLGEWLGLCGAEAMGLDLGETCVWFWFWKWYLEWGNVSIQKDVKLVAWFKTVTQ